MQKKEPSLKATGRSTKQGRLRFQAAKIGSSESSGNKVSSLDFQEELGIELLLLCIERSRAQASPRDPSWMPLSGGITGMSGRKETVGQEMGLYIPPSRKMPQGPLQEAGGHGWREGHLGYVWEPLQLTQPAEGSGKLIDG